MKKEAPKKNAKMPAIKKLGPKVAEEVKSRKSKITEIAETAMMVETEDAPDQTKKVKPVTAQMPAMPQKVVEKQVSASVPKGVKLDLDEVLSSIRQKARPEPKLKVDFRPYYK